MKKFAGIKIFVLLNSLILCSAQDFKPLGHLKIDPNSIIPPSNVKSQIANVKGSNNSTKALVNEFCPSLENADLLTDEEFFEHLVHPCRYDRIQRPKEYDGNGNSLPVNVFVRSFIYYLQNLDTHELQFKMQTLLQMRYVDPRLKFKSIAPLRIHPIMGEEDLRKKIWVPHVFFSNERDSGVLGTYGHHILTTIYPDGTVIISSRLQATLFCPMDLRKFPFDSQECRATIECWMYNASQVQLHWEKISPLTMGPDKILTEYVLRNTSTHEAMVIANENDLRHGAFIGNYSSITFNFKVDRQAGFYMLEYFLPSVMIVAISWVSFYLQADQTAPRAMLGATSMLSFITLSSAQNKILPKVSYIKALEVWSMACTAFIFMSLVEFAFVNVIWRRRKHVELKKVNISNILKHTLTAREVRMALGIDTSRSVANVSEATKNEEDFYVNQSRIEKRRSIDVMAKSLTMEDEFMRPSNMPRSSSYANINDYKKQSFGTNDLNHSLSEKPQMYEENILLHENKHQKPSIEKKTKFDIDFPAIDCEKSFQNSQTIVHRKNSIVSKSQKFDDHRRKSIMIPIILTEDDHGEYKMEMDASKVLGENDDSFEILIDNESTVGSYIAKPEERGEEVSNNNEHYHKVNHHSLYDGWTRMTPHEISHWIDKRSRLYFPFAFAVFNAFYWTFVYLF